MAVQYEPLQVGHRRNAVQFLIDQRSSNNKRSTEEREFQKGLVCSALCKKPHTHCRHTGVSLEGLDELPANSPCAAARHGATSSSTQTSHRLLLQHFFLPSPSIPIQLSEALGTEQLGKDETKHPNGSSKENLSTCFLEMWRALWAPKEAGVCWASVI